MVKFTINTQRHSLKFRSETNKFIGNLYSYKASYALTYKLITSLLLLIFLFFTNNTKAQSAYGYVKQGNKDIKEKNYTEAEIYYRKSLDKKPEEIVPVYNIGVSQYLQNNFEQAQGFFTNSAEKFENKEDKAQAYHNLGNAYLEEKKYEESIKAYKEALKLVPNDMDTKYNLAYAQLMLKKKQQQQQENKQNQNDKQEQNKDEQNKDNKDKQDQNKDQEGDKDKQDQKDKGQEEQEKNGNQDQQNGNKGEEEQEKPAQPKEMKLSKEQADKLLKALENEENKLQEKLDKPEGEPIRVIIEKDW